MKFLKKIMPIVLCAMMLFALIPCAALADGGATTPAVEAKWGADADNLTGEGTLAEAIDAAEASSTIKYIQLQKDITATGTYTINGGKFTLDLDSCTVSYDNTQLFYVSGSTTDVTMENGTISAINQALYVYGAKVTVRNLTAKDSDDSKTAVHMTDGTLVSEGLDTVGYINHMGGVIEFKTAGDCTVFANASNTEIGTNIILSEYLVAYDGSNELSGTVANGTIFTVKSAPKTYTLASGESVTVNGITYTAKANDTKVVFAVDEYVTGEGNTDPFVVVLAGRVDCNLGAGQKLTVAYENENKNGYTNSKTIDAGSATNVVVSLDDTSDKDSIVWSYGTVTVEDVAYTYTPSGSADLMLDFDDDEIISYSSQTSTPGTLEVSAPRSYTEVFNGYDFVKDGRTGDYSATFALDNGGKVTLNEGIVALDDGEFIYVEGAKVEADGTAYVMNTNLAKVFGFATITDVTAASVEDQTVLTIEDYTIYDFEEGYVATVGDTIACAMILPHLVEQSLGGRFMMVVETLETNGSLQSHAIVAKTGSKSAFAYSKEDGVSFTLDKGTALMAMDADASLIFHTEGYSKKITAEERIGDNPLGVEAGKAPDETDIRFKVEDAPSTPSTPTQHTWGPFVSIDGIDHVRECLDEGCDAYEIMEHAWEKSLIIKEPTHTEYGEQRYTCWFCDATKIMPVEKLWQHNYESGWTHDEDAHWHACECGATSEKAAHTFENIVHELALAEAGDCENSTVYYKSCSVCGILSDETFIGAEADGHDFGAYVSNGDATCEADGTKTATCSACGAKDTVTDEGSKIAHNFGAYTSDGNATCEADGTKTATCSACGAKDTVTDEGSKIAHSFGEYSSDGNATCEADGTKTATCSVCGAKDTVTDEGSMLAHTYEKGICTACGAEDPDYTGLAWLWITLGVLAVLGGGFAVYWFVIRKKAK